MEEMKADVRALRTAKNIGYQEARSLRKQILKDGGTVRDYLNGSASKKDMVHTFTIVVHSEFDDLNCGMVAHWLHDKLKSNLFHFVEIN